MAESRRVASSKPDDLELLRKSDQANTKVIAARSAMRKGNREEAKAHLKEVFALVPGDQGAIEILGDIYLAEGETEKAVRLYERALAMYPGHALFQERLATCHLDLAEMENDRLAKELLLSEGDLGKKYELQPSKAVGLSLLLVGTGQFYNDEVEKGFFFLVAGLATFAGWFWPLMTAINNLTREDRLKVEMAIGSMSGFTSALFWIMMLFWTAIYAIGAIDAGMTAARINEDRRRGLGL